MKLWRWSKKIRLWLDLTELNFGSLPVLIRHRSKLTSPEIAENHENDYFSREEVVNIDAELERSKRNRDLLKKLDEDKITLGEFVVLWKQNNPPKVKGLSKKRRRKMDTKDDDDFDNEEISQDELTEEEQMELVSIEDEARWGNISRAQRRLDIFNMKVRARLGK